MSEIKNKGFKLVCMYCKKELKGSDPIGDKVSHGFCEPLCAGAIAGGWGEFVKPKVGAAATIIASAIVGLAFVSCAHGATIDTKFLNALATVESNNNPNAIGDGGRSYGAFQIQSAVWHDVNKSRGAVSVIPFETAFDRDRARDFAYCHLTNLQTRFITATGKQPTASDLYAAWNLGFTGFRRRDFSLSKCPQTTQRAAAKLNRIMDSQISRARISGLPALIIKPNTASRDCGNVVR